MELVEALHTQIPKAFSQALKLIGRGAPTSSGKADLSIHKRRVSAVSN
jgi:hypothetical protein